MGVCYYLLQELWDRANNGNFPLFGLLNEMSSYVFTFVNSLAVLEEVDDESKRIRDIKPVLGVLVVIKRSIERPGEQLLKTHISHLIGKGEHITLFHTQKSRRVYLPKVLTE